MMLELGEPYRVYGNYMNTKWHRSIIDTAVDGSNIGNLNLSDCLISFKPGTVFTIDFLETLLALLPADFVRQGRTATNITFDPADIGDRGFIVRSCFKNGNMIGNTRYDSRAEFLYATKSDIELNDLVRILAELKAIENIHQQLEPQGSATMPDTVYAISAFFPNLPKQCFLSKDGLLYQYDGTFRSDICIYDTFEDASVELLSQLRNNGGYFNGGYFTIIKIKKGVSYSLLS